MRDDVRLPWWHRRVVLVSDDEGWAERAGGMAQKLGAQWETRAWAEAAALQGPVGALVARVGSAGADVEHAFVRWAGQAWQPLTLVWLPPVRRAAKVAHLLDELHYGSRFHEVTSRGPDGELETGLARILERGGWIVPRFASALGWSAEPFLVHVLSLPLLATVPPTSVEAWRRAAGNLSYAEFEQLFYLHGAPPPKRVLDPLRIAGAAVWAAAQKRVPERSWLASHLGYASEHYLGRRVKQLSGLTAGELVRLPVDRVMEALTRSLREAASGGP